MSGVKESLELIAGVELVALAGVDIAKGGIGLDDVPKALELASHHKELIEAVKGLDHLGEELKDLDEAELVQLGSALWASMKKIRAAVKEAQAV